MADRAAFGVSIGLSSSRQVARSVSWRRRLRAVLAIWTRLQAVVAHSSRAVANCCSERNNIGIFAAAAWCAGEIAIEEFATRRGERWACPGRNDLYLRLGRTALCIEAKLVKALLPSEPSDWEQLHRLVRSRLRAARREAVQTRVARGVFQLRVAVVFCVILLGRRHEEELELHRRRFIPEVRRYLVRPPIDFWAAHLPSCTLHLPGAQRRYVGLLLLGSTRA